MSYTDIYQKRIDRFGKTFQERIQNEREYDFDLYLERSIYKIDFLFNNKAAVGSFEPYKEDDSKILHYLLTQRDLDMPSGTILEIKNKDNVKEKWMVYSLEQTKASGYNRYIMVKLNYFVEFNSTKYYGTIEGPGNKPIKDTLRSGHSNVIYGENENLYMFITPLNDVFHKDDYLEIKVPYANDYITKAFKITDYDIVSLRGINFISLDPIYEKDKSPVPTPGAGEDTDKYYWFGG